MKQACFTLDTEPDIGNSDGITLFSQNKYLKHLNQILKEFEIQITAFLVTKLLKTNPQIIELINKELTVNFELHSHSHNQHKPDTEYEISKAVELYTNFFNQKPMGYRAPNGLISECGLETLINYDFQYDSSIFPSFRFDKYSYFNLNLPNTPFLFSSNKGSLVELPIGTVNGIRFIISLSYIKLFGWKTYEFLIDLLGLPDIVIIDAHPYDFTINHHLSQLTGWKKWVHARNSDNTFEILNLLLSKLRDLGYEFVTMKEIFENLQKGEFGVIPERMTL